MEKRQVHALDRLVIEYGKNRSKWITIAIDNLLRAERERYGQSLNSGTTKVKKQELMKSNVLPEHK